MFSYTQDRASAAGKITGKPKAPCFQASSGPAFLNKAALELLGLFKAARACLLPPSCRFVPSCSQYAAQALESRPFFTACKMILSRLLKCHPYG